MGGHGGLNILPQKSWNVYGRENRLKVARDEAKHAEEQAVLLGKQKQAEGEQRRSFLLRRARERGGQTQHDSMEESEIATTDAEGAKQHFTLFTDDTSRDQNPEILEEKRLEEQRHGNKDTRTSDAKFDAQFKFASTMGGKANQPWYSRPSVLLDETVQPKAAPAALGSATTTILTATDARAPKPQKQKHKHKHKHKHKDDEVKHKHRTKRKGKEGSSKADEMRQHLREERSVREASERARQQMVIRSSQPTDPSPASGKKYHSAFSAGRR